MKLQHAVLVVLCSILPTGFAMAEQFPSHALADGPPITPLMGIAPSAPGMTSSAPFVWFDDDGRQYKLDDGHLTLTQDSTHAAGTMLLRGSLGLATDHALGADYNRLTAVAGTRLELSNGLTLRQSIEILRDDPVSLIPGDWTLPARTGPAWTTLRVDQGQATLAGPITIHAPTVKDGAGTLRLTEFNQSVAGNILTVQQGGLRMDGLWLSCPIHTDPGTVLSGTGFIHEAVVAGHLQPGSPDAVGTLMFNQRLQLAATAQTRIRIAANGQADSLFTWGTMRLDGELFIHATPGEWTPQTRWTLAEAQDGLELDEAAAPSAPFSILAASAATPTPGGNGRFTSVRSNLRYLSPVLTYLPTTLVLSLAYNRYGLNTVDGAWRSALVEDSRFLRESALAHAEDSGAWVQTWGFNAQRPSDTSLPGDDRDTMGLQIGVTRHLGQNPSVSAFAGTQSMDLSSRYGPAGSGYGARDTSAHLGLQLSGLVAPNLRLTAGAAHAWHSTRLQRRADPTEPRLRSHSRAELTQAWLEARANRPLPVGDWGWIPYARLTWLHLSRPSVVETGSLAAVALSPRSEQRWASHLGVQLQRRWGTPHGDALFTADVGIHSLWGGRTLNSPQAYRSDPSQTWDVASPELTRHALRVNLGVDAPVTKRIRVGLTYGGQYDRHQMQHGVWLGVKVMF